MGLPTRVFMYGASKVLEHPAEAAIVGTAAWHARNWTARVVGSVLYRQLQANTRIIKDIWRHSKMGNEPLGGRSNPYWKRPIKYLGAASVANPVAAGATLALSAGVGHQLIALEG
jgi:hypothetical protein